MKWLGSIRNFADREIELEIDHSRDSLLTDFSKATLQDRYLGCEESYQCMFGRVAAYYADDDNHAMRLYKYISNLWLIPATPILSNGGTERGFPISCFLNEVEDSLEGIMDLWNENVWIASRGGGIGSYWGNVRSIGETIHRVGATSGIMPFIKVMDAMTLAISQGSLRRGSAATYLPVSHPEIEEFIEMRKPTGGDPNRKAPNMNHGVLITDDFMSAVENGEDWALKSPQDQSVIRVISARSLWVKILTIRVATGEPYIIFIDSVNKSVPEHHKKSNLMVKTSNLCSEIILPTGKDHHGNNRTAICCLSSVNLEKFDQWSWDEVFLEDCMRFLDNVLQDFVNKAPDTLKNARYSAERERSVGLGAMGFHSYLLSKTIPFSSVLAKILNKKIFKHMKDGVSAANVKLAHERGPCPDAAEHNVMLRFSYATAVAPNASTGIIAGTSPSIEPLPSNAYTHKTQSGSFLVRNPYLESTLEAKNMNTRKVWSSIVSYQGSVQHLDFLDENEKKLFKTAYEINPLSIVELASDRTPYIDQSQSVNLFLPANIRKSDLHRIHMTAWKSGLKSLYYCRSMSLQRGASVDLASLEAADCISCE